MRIKSGHHWLLKFLLLLVAVVIFSTQFVFADHYRNTKEETLKDFMKVQQGEIEKTYDNLDTRIQKMDIYNPKKKCLQDGCPKLGIKNSLLDIAKSAKDDFNDLNVDDDDTLIEKIGSVYQTTPAFDEPEHKALVAIREVQKFIIKPLKPANVPEGDIIKAFLPQLIRLLFSFTSLAVLISFVVSGVFMIISMDDEEKITKAKHAMMYSLVGLLFIILAFALVKAITNIDFFGSVS